MSKVVVGFDFSAGSAKAVDLAIDIANRWHSDLRLVYVSEREEDETPLREEIERRNAGVAHLLQGISMEYVIRHGNPATELSEQAEADHATLLVVGTHGMSGLKTNLLGRNSYRTIEHSPVPVLIVREDFDFDKDLETIVLPIDSSDETRQKVREAAMFARTFGSTVHLLGLYTSSSNDIHRIVDSYMLSVERYLEKAGVNIIKKSMEVDQNVSADTLAYATAVRADLVVIMTEQEKTFRSLILGNYAQQLINHASMPVLTVRPKQVMADNANY